MSRSGSGASSSSENLILKPEWLAPRNNNATQDAHHNNHNHKPHHNRHNPKRGERNARNVRWRTEEARGRGRAVAEPEAPVDKGPTIGPWDRGGRGGNNAKKSNAKDPLRIPPFSPSGITETPTAVKKTLKPVPNKVPPMLRSQSTGALSEQRRIAAQTLRESDGDQAFILTEESDFPALPAAATNSRSKFFKSKSLGSLQYTPNAQQPNNINNNISRFRNSNPDEGSRNCRSDTDFEIGGDTDEENAMHRETRSEGSDSDYIVAYNDYNSNENSADDEGVLECWEDRVPDSEDSAPPSTTLSTSPVSVSFALPDDDEDYSAAPITIKTTPTTTTLVATTPPSDGTSPRSVSINIPTTIELTPSSPRDASPPNTTSPMSGSPPSPTGPTLQLRRKPGPPIDRKLLMQRKPSFSAKVMETLLAPPAGTATGKVEGNGINARDPALLLPVPSKPNAPRLIKSRSDRGYLLEHRKSATQQALSAAGYHSNESSPEKGGLAPVVYRKATSESYLLHWKKNMGAAPEEPLKVTPITDKQAAAAKAKMMNNKRKVEAMQRERNSFLDELRRKEETKRQVKGQQPQQDQQGEQTQRLADPGDESPPPELQLIQTDTNSIGEFASNGGTESGEDDSSESSGGEKDKSDLSLGNLSTTCTDGGGGKGKDDGDKRQFSEAAMFSFMKQLGWQGAEGEDGIDGDGGEGEDEVGLTEEEMMGINVASQADIERAREKRKGQLDASLRLWQDQRQIRLS